MENSNSFSKTFPGTIAACLKITVKREPELNNKFRISNYELFGVNIALSL